MELRNVILAGFALVTSVLSAGDEARELGSREEALEHLQSEDKRDVAAANRYFRDERSVELAELMFARLFRTDIETEDGLRIAQVLMISISRMIANPPTIYTKDFPRGEKDLALRCFVWRSNEHQDDAERFIAFKDESGITR